MSLAEAGLGAAIVPADALAGGLPAGLAARVLEGLSVGAATTLATATVSVTWSDLQSGDEEIE